MYVICRESKIVHIITLAWEGHFFFEEVPQTHHMGMTVGSVHSPFFYNPKINSKHMLYVHAFLLSAVLHYLEKLLIVKKSSEL